jgi:hypothetical protein
MKLTIMAAITAAVMCSATPALADQICTASFKQTAQKALRSDTYSSDLVFKTHSVFGIGNQTLVLAPQGTRVFSANIIHVIMVTSPNGSTTAVTGKIQVVNSQIVHEQFCATQTELAT